MIRDTATPGFLSANMHGCRAKWLAGSDLLQVSFWAYIMGSASITDQDPRDSLILRKVDLRFDAQRTRVKKTEMGEP